MTTQDPELSAALGWPGGISDPVRDRTRLLQIVAAMRLASQQALEALEHATPTTDWSYMITALRAALAESGRDWSLLEATQESLREHMTEIHRLRAALAQQTEPAQAISECIAVLRPMVKGKFPHEQALDELVGYTAPPQQADPTDPGRDVNVLREHVRHLERRVRQLHAQQAEPVQEPVAYFGSAYVNENGVHITTVLGPVAIPQDAKLYTAPPQRTMVPLTEEEIFKIENDIPDDVISDRAWTICLTRAVEKAVWEKNHGKA